jgi:hypothetical protein
MKDYSKTVLGGELFVRRERIFTSLPQMKEPKRSQKLKLKSIFLII